ncbi:hypothetical protein S7335_4790 [Synechococcus sp. PCC 7335]|uniref:DUF6825 family protein n=1 Tax=Synechococcus sp. (strain ATCC 29403 / PCC 7335) TaxID=91464 RepID=UPI00017EB073|nr:hypothetical protein [Synechococcus sp. PCC 7335]EDX87083.1 hypothetical protein S7335_4790 [Synechococcus sp. PCC 7335]
MLQAFFVGRALAAAVSERAEHLVSDGLGKLGKFDAEQREYFRQFTEEVMARAEQEQAAAGVTSDSVATGTGSTTGGDVEDLQMTIDNLRAEIAQARAAIQQYRQN